MAKEHRDVLHENEEDRDTALKEYEDVYESWEEADAICDIAKQKLSTICNEYNTMKKQFDSKSNNVSSSSIHANNSQSRRKLKASTSPPRLSKVLEVMRRPLLGRLLFNEH